MKKKIFLGALLLVCPAVVLAGELERVPVHFVVLSSHEEVHHFATAEQFEREIQNLNENFVSEKRVPLFSFFQKSVSHYEDIENSSCEWLRLGDQSEKPPKELRGKLFEECDDPLVRDRQAINFYVFRSTYEGNDPWKNSYAGFLKPWLLVNWERMKTRHMAAQEHEMGHVFGLWHTLACGSTTETPTDFMAAKSDLCDGGAGDRSQGLNLLQVAAARFGWSWLKRQLRKGDPLQP